MGTEGLYVLGASVAAAGYSSRLFFGGLVGVFSEVVLKEIHDVMPVRIVLLIYVSLILKIPVLIKINYLLFKQHYVDVLPHQGVLNYGDADFGQSQLHLIEMLLLHLR